MRVLLSFIFSIAFLFCSPDNLNVLAAEPFLEDSATREASPPVTHATSPGSYGDGPVSTSSPSETIPFFQRIFRRAETAWTDGRMDLYIPLYAWHNRFMYHSGEGSEYNETPWGGGIGKSFYDEDGDFHGLFIMGFEDSNYHFQPVMGYTYVKNWSLADEMKFGLGVAAGLSARHELYYIPFPAALPLVSFEYESFAIQATYIPGQYNHGNVLFTWTRWHFD